MHFAEFYSPLFYAGASNIIRIQMFSGSTYGRNCTGTENDLSECTRNLEGSSCVTSSSVLCYRTEGCATTTVEPPTTQPTKTTGISSISTSTTSSSLSTSDPETPDATEMKTVTTPLIKPGPSSFFNPPTLYYFIAGLAALLVVSAALVGVLLLVCCCWKGRKSISQTSTDQKVQDDDPSIYEDIDEPGNGLRRALPVASDHILTETPEVPMSTSGEGFDCSDNPAYSAEAYNCSENPAYAVAHCHNPVYAEASSMQAPSEDYIEMS